MTAKDTQKLLDTLKARFEANMQRHKGIAWRDVQARLDDNRAALKSLREMEATGGEPDVTGVEKKSGQFLFVDCSTESPAGRRSTCYDGEARASRKENKPISSAVEMAATMGEELLTEDQYPD